MDGMVQTSEAVAPILNQKTTQMSEFWPMESTAPYFSPSLSVCLCHTFRFLMDGKDFGVMIRPSAISHQLCYEIKIYIYIYM